MAYSPAPVTSTAAPARHRWPRDGEAALFVRLKRHSDLGARESLFERYWPLARQLARRYRRANEPIEDLEQVAGLALVKAIDRFDPARETGFSSFAVPTILGELKRYFRDSTWTTHVPRGLQERAMLVGKAMDELARKLGRSPSIAQIAAYVQRSQEEVIEAMEAAASYHALPFERTRGDQDDGWTNEEWIGHDDGGYEFVEYRAAVQEAVRSLPDRERRLLHLRFVGDMTQSEIAARLGISQMHVSRLLRAALDELRESVKPG